MLSKFLLLCVSKNTPQNALKENVVRALFAISKIKPIFITKMSYVYTMRLSCASFEAIVEYGIVSVSMTPSSCRQIDVTNNRIIRAALGTTWPDTMPSI